MDIEMTADEATLACIDAHVEAARRRDPAVPEPREAESTDLVAGVIRALHPDRVPEQTV